MKLIKKLLKKVYEALTQTGEYQLDTSRLNHSKKDFERYVVVGYFVGYIIICGFGTFLSLNTTHIVDFLISLSINFINSHLTFVLLASIIYLLLREFGMKHIYIYDVFENKNEHVTNIHKPEGSSVFQVTTEKGFYAVEIERSQISIEEKPKDEKTDEKNPSLFKSLEEVLTPTISKQDISTTHSSTSPKKIRQTRTVRKKHSSKKYKRYHKKKKQ